MKDIESSGAANVSIKDIDDDLLKVTDEDRNGDVMANSLVKSCTSIWILDSGCSHHVCLIHMRERHEALSCWETKQAVVFWVWEQ